LLSFGRMEEGKEETATFDVLGSPRSDERKKEDNAEEQDLIDMIPSPLPHPIEPKSTSGTATTAPRGRVAYNINDTLPTELILLRREKKIAIPIPEIDWTDPLEGNTEARRLHRVYLSTKKFLHLYQEAIGGVYGVSSRPEIEIHVFKYSYHPTSPPSVSLSTGAVSDISSVVVQLNLIYDPENNLYVLSPHMEDLLIVYLLYTQSTVSSFLSPSSLPPLLSSTQRIGNHEFNTLDPFRQRQWRRFLRLYIAPLLLPDPTPTPSFADLTLSASPLPLRVQRAVDYMKDYAENTETAGYVTPDDDEDGDANSSDSDSDEGKGKKKKRKGKKKGTGTGGGAWKAGGTKSSGKKTGGVAGGAAAGKKSQSTSKNNPKK
jgi:hypothetical protein